MAEPRPTLRFDRREIAVVFSLFVFISLLMFTVGILVGKSITQSRNNAATTETADTEEHSEASGHGEADAHGSPHKPAEKHHEATTAHAEKSEHGADHHEKAAHEEKHEAETEVAEEQKEAEPPLELVPLKPERSEVAGTTLRDQASVEEADRLLADPKIRALLDETDRKIANDKAKGKTKRRTASIEEPTKQDFTVQVGSYSSQADADARVKHLQNLGFHDAYRTTKKLGGSSGTWHRVWLGYFSDANLAQASGESLQAKGEIKTFLVRRSNARED